MTFIANPIVANKGSYINFELNYLSIANNPFSYYNNIYYINKPNQDLVPFKPILNQNYFKYMNNTDPYLLYKDIWGTNNWLFETDESNSYFIINEKITLPNTISSSGKKYQINSNLPFFISIEKYIVNHLKANNLSIYYSEVLSNFRVEAQSSKFSSGIYLLNKKVGDTHISINLAGNISIGCDLCYDSNQNQSGNQADSQWELDVDQSQTFSLESIIGKKLSIKAEQNSKSDFDWENSLLLEYNGDDDEIIKKITAGNISLNLPGTKIVSVGMGKRTGLFGIKIENQFGPLNMQTIIGREKVSKNMISRNRDSGGLQSEEYTPIADYSFMRDTYFFIDKIFKSNFYPIGLQGQYSPDPCYEIDEFELFEKMTTNLGNSDNITGTYTGTAYINPSNLENQGSAITGTWKKLEKGIDYFIDIDRGMKKRGYVRMAGSTIKILASHYTIKECSNQERPNTGTDMNFVYDNDFIPDDCLNDNPCINNDFSLIEGSDYNEQNGLEGYQGKQLTLKLIKESTGTSDLSSCPNTYALMFKNAYSLGGQNISPNSLDVKIIHKNGITGNETDLNGKSLLRVFGLDNVNNTTLQIDTTSGGDGIIDITNGAILDLSRGDLIFPFHMPFAYDPNSANPGGKIWGNTSEELSDYVVALEDPVPMESDVEGNPFINIYSSGPAMYYSAYDATERLEEYEFTLNVKHSSSSSSMSLGFMVVPNSETVLYNNSEILIKGIDYTIDYNIGSITWLSTRAKDPTADITVSCDNYELISFDQKIMAGTFLNYQFSPDNLLFGGLYYYTQALKDRKVDIGQEPMTNWMWNIGGSFSHEIMEINNYINDNSYLDFDKPSKIDFAFEYAEVYPDPNPLGTGYIDDFEGSELSSYITTQYTSYKKSSLPSYIDMNDSLVRLDNQNRIDMAWFTKSIPVQSVWKNYDIAGNYTGDANKASILELELKENSKNYLSDASSIFWNGVTLRLSDSDENQSRNEYLDIWLNSNEVENESLIFNIDIGHISEDLDRDGILDTEDRVLEGTGDDGALGYGDGVFQLIEDIGIDVCTDAYENGWGGCLCSNFNSSNQCIDVPSITYEQAMLDSNNDLINFNTEISDPNRDNYSKPEGVDIQDKNYSNANKTQGNGCETCFDVFKRPDSEDLDSENNGLNAQDSYFFTYSFNLKDENNPMIISYDGDDGDDQDVLGDWKLYRIPLNDFDAIIENDNYVVGWDNVKHLRIWVRGENITEDNYIKIAKIELVGNQWEQLGVVENNDSDNNIDFEINSLLSDGTISDEQIAIDENITIQVVNTEENSSTYSPPGGVVGNYDAANDRFEKEQSLSIDFGNVGIGGEWDGGLASNRGVFVKRNFDYSSGSKDQSFFIYKNIEMYIQSIKDENSNDWYQDENSLAEISIRFGREGHYYEVRKPLTNDNIELNEGTSVNNSWDQFKINLDQLTNYKNNRYELEDCEDWGLDHCPDNRESGSGNCIPNDLNLTTQQICDYACDETDCTEEIAYTNGWFVDDFDSDFYFEINDFSVDFEFNSICLDSYCGVNNFEEDCNEINNCEWSDDAICESIIPYISDPNLDNASDGICTQECYDQSGSCEDGELASKDLNGNGIYDVPSYAYDNFNDIFYWDDGAEYCADGSDLINCPLNVGVKNIDLNDICEDCTKLSIAGEPAINRIDYIMVGIINENDNSTIYGSVYINELRMTGVKKDKGQKFVVDGSFNFGDLLSMTASHSRENHDYHMLEQRISQADYYDYQSLNFNLDITELFKENFIDIPISYSETETFKSPKYQPGSDIILTEGEENIFTSFSGIVDEKYQYKKKTKMFNTSIRPKLSNIYNNSISRLVDNVSFDYSYSSTELSTEVNKKDNSESETFKYNFTDSKSVSEMDDYSFQPFQNIELKDDSKILTFLQKLKDFKIYFRPKKIISTGYLTKNTSQTISRSSQDTITTNTQTYTKTFKIDDYRLFENFNTDYYLTMNSNVSKNYKGEISDIIDPWSPVGDLRTWGESFSFTLDPDFADWLSPNITYSPQYSWNKNLASSIENPAATIKSKNNFTIGFNFSPQKFIELFYKSGSSSKSSYSNSYSKNKSSNKNSGPKYEIKNHYIKSFLKYLYTLSQKLSTISITAKYNTTHEYFNIDANFDPSYDYRLGLTTVPDNLVLSGDTGGLLTSHTRKYTNEFRITTTLQITKNLSLSSMEYKYTEDRILYSDSERNINISNSFFPLGANGRGGLPIFTYSINLNRLEEYWGLNKSFKSISLSHSYNGSENKTYKDYQGELNLEKVDFTKNFSPLISLTMKINDIERTEKINEEDFSFTTRFNNLLTIYNTFDQIHRKVTQEFTFGTSYRTDTDIRIKLPKKKILELKNDMVFRLDLTYSESYDEFAYVLTNDLDNFSRTSFSKNFNLKPSMTYDFSKFVSGEVYLTHIITESNTQGEKTETCFGFDVIILFESMDTNSNSNNYQSRGNNYSPYF